MKAIKYLTGKWLVGTSQSSSGNYYSSLNIWAKPMALSDVTKDGHRVNMYFSAELYTEMKEWVTTNNTNITELCREAIRDFLQSKRHEQNQKELEETCQMLAKEPNGNIEYWTSHVQRFVGNNTL
ncbi:ribbon-helix-helix domain-containing protein [bacterium]|nr:ribbon-helix-helix domain-containing protein [bacterium]